MSRPFLEIKHVRKAFNGRAVLDGISLDVAHGSITTIMGKSGIGKSVLLKCIAGIHRPDSGEILLDGQKCIGHNCGKSSTRLSYLFQQNALFDSMTAADNVALPIIETTRVSRRAARRRVDQLFEQLDLGDVAGKYPAEISGGMQKRVALARALITEPQLILFDEPTTGLDPQRKNSVFTMIADYRRRFDFTALMVCHDIPEALFVSDRVAWVNNGRVQFYGAPTNLEVATDPDLLEFVYHRNALLSEVAGQRGRSALFAEWPALRQSFDAFVVVTCATERLRPGAELGLRRFASFQAAVTGVAKLPRARSDIYFLDERHFGFAAAPDSAGRLHDEIVECLRPANEAAASDPATRYVWSARSYPLATLLDPALLWSVVDLPNTVAPFARLSA
jgi:phospholipid/cholesterol/gamma-HCH transport system ATP-binding protein